MPKSRAKTKAGKQRKVHDVMDEYKKGKLKSGRGGKGGKVKSRKQAIAIALSESGQDKPPSKRPSAKKNYRSTAAKKAAATRKRKGTASRAGRKAAATRKRTTKKK